MFGRKTSHRISRISAAFSYVPLPGEQARIGKVNGRCPKMAGPKNGSDFLCSKVDPKRRVQNVAARARLSAMLGRSPICLLKW